jgi:hypothetical protein
MAGTTPYRGFSGKATEARRRGMDARAVEQQGGWAPGSRAVAGNMHRVDIWEDNAGIRPRALGSTTATPRPTSLAQHP